MPAKHVQISDHALFLLEEVKALYGSYKQASMKLGIPWSTFAAVSSKTKPPSPALTVTLSIALSRDPLPDLARVEAEVDRDTWSKLTWQRLAGEAKVVSRRIFIPGKEGRPPIPRAHRMAEHPTQAKLGV